MVRRKKIAFLLIPLFVFFAYLFLYLPMLVLVTFSFNDSPISLKWVGFTLKWYKNILASPEILNALWVSLIVAFGATTLSLLLGTFFVLSSRWWKGSFLYHIFYTNIILPDIILAVSILSIFTFFKIPLGYGSLIAGHTVIGLGFVVPIIKARFNELDPALTEASLDLGAGYIKTFFSVLLPLLTPALIASGLLVFTLSLDDFLVAFFCSSPTVQTLSVYVYSMIKAIVDPTINAISTCLLFVSSILVLLLSFFKVMDRVISNE
ncbi:ABC transporter permease subunit [Candidatus Dependentiae bacterium]|nr:ABC transporter permease subunit [Candidatus Dependentiae bacterium]